MHKPTPREAYRYNPDAFDMGMAKHSHGQWVHASDYDHLRDHIVILTEMIDALVAAAEAWVERTIINGEPTDDTLAESVYALREARATLLRWENDR